MRQKIFFTILLILLPLFNSFAQTSQSSEDQISKESELKEVLMELSSEEIPIEASLFSNNQITEDSHYKEILQRTSLKDMEVIRTFKIGSRDFEIGHLYEDIQGGMRTCPTDVLITDNYIYMNDVFNKRFVAFSKNNEEFRVILKSFDSEAYNLIEGNDEYIINSGPWSSESYIYNNQKNQIIIERPLFIPSKSHPRYGIPIFELHFLQERFLIYNEVEEEEFVVIDLVKENKSVEEILYNDEALEYISQNCEDLIVEEGKYLKYMGQLLTKNVYLFLNYHEEHKSDLNYNVNFMDYDIGDSTYSGIDNDGNIYWSVYDTIYIFRKDGSLLLKVELDNDTVQHKVTSRFSIDSIGNIYCLLIDEENQNYNLAQVKRDW